MKALVPKQIWFSPTQFPWPVNWEMEEQFWSTTSGTCEQRYAALWQHIETTPARCVPFPVPKNARGRAMTMTTSPVTAGKVIEVRQEELAIVLDKPMQFDLTEPVVCQAVLQQTVPPMTVETLRSEVLDAGHLPGILQSAIRAEVFAVLRALQIAEGSAERLFL
ncbi:unnamed protein product [Cladocopium goreaui]|uniref:Uncharacterized protein n=1 Tax=Cladocopium goreaui TaxID=2562237 RepID=A0A9P1D6F6_9DINO|nr:unnamed protein product [Cladocopium goreaui]